MDFGKNLKKILGDMGITQRQFAEMTGKEEGYISRVLNGRQNASWETITHFAEVLGVNPAVFFSTDEEEIVKSALKQLTPELQEFIKSRPNAPYLYLAKDLQEMNYNPDDIKRLVELWEKTVTNSQRNK